MSTTLPSEYPLYDTVYGSEIPTEQYFVILFKKLPSKFVNNVFYDPKITEHFLEVLGFKQEVDIFSSNRRYDLSAQSLYVNHDKKLMIRVYGNTSKDKDPLVQLVQKIVENYLLVLVPLHIQSILPLPICLEWALAYTAITNPLCYKGFLLAEQPGVDFQKMLDLVTMRIAMYLA